MGVSVSGLLKPEEGVYPFRAGVIAVCEPPNVGAGTKGKYFLQEQKLFFVFLEIHHLSSLVMLPLPVCLPFMDLSNS